MSDNKFMRGASFKMDQREGFDDPIDHSVAMPGEGIDAKNGWHDRGNPLEGFEDDPITLAADELAKLFQWMITGGEKRTGPAPAAARDMSGHQLAKALRRPSIIGARVVAMLLRIRPDLLNGMSAKEVAGKIRISPRMMAFYTMNFGEHFPQACKVIRRKSRHLTQQKIKSHRIV